MFVQHRSLVWIPVIVLVLAVAGCDVPVPESADPEVPAVLVDVDGLGRIVRAEKWNATNSPSIFPGVTLEYKLDALPQEGQAQNTPWPDTYWPTYEDSINVRWQVSGWGSQEVTKDTLSPAEKYDLAFNNWTVDDAFLKLKPYSSSNCSDKSWDKTYYDKLGPAAKYVSDYKGNKNARDGADNDADGQTDECDDRDGVETWWGLCHAWVPAAILEKEPKKPVVQNGVKFEVSDIKALLIAMYDRSQAVLVGGRCNDKETKKDEKTGRLTSDVCRDVNAGTYHVLMANFLGKQKRAIAEDRTYDYQVWNQPVRGWKVSSIKEIKIADAVKILKLPENTTKYTYNTSIKKLYEVYATTYYITESEPSTRPSGDEIENFTREDDYHYVLEVDKYGKIIGGEWAPESQTNHPDFLWLPLGPGGGNPYMNLDKIHQLAEKSRAEEPVVPPADMKEYASTAAVDIPDNNPTGATSTIAVPDDFVIGAKAEVEVNIEHTYVGDLTVTLVKGDRKTVLQDKAGGSAHDLKKTFSTTDFTGQSSKGDWKLLVVDSAGSDTGKIVSWKLRLANPGGGGTPAGGTLKAAASDLPKAIPDDAPAGVTSTITVTDAKTVKTVKVTVKIQHTYVGALNVTLTHGGNTKTLSSQEGGSATAIDRSWDLGEFAGAATNGAWELKVVDTDAYGDSGTIQAFSLEITY